MTILLFGRVLDLICSVITAITATYLTYKILPETIHPFFSMPLGMVLGGAFGMMCGMLFSLINVMFNLIMHTMFIGMFCGMVASCPSKYTISISWAFIVWLVLVVSDEYFIRVIDKVEFELN